MIAKIIEWFGQYKLIYENGEEIVFDDYYEAKKYAMEDETINELGILY